MRTFTFLLAAATVIPCAYAEGSDESGWYAGLSYERLQETDGQNEYQALGLTGGYDFNRYFGAEVTAATGIDGDGTFSPGARMMSMAIPSPSRPSGRRQTSRIALI